VILRPSLVILEDVAFVSLATGMTVAEDMMGEFR
jgi:hypothetical protein